MTRVNYSYTLLIVLFTILLSVNSFSTGTASAKQFIVVIDPGHGGKDPGAVNKNIQEKDIVLGIGLKFGKLIKDNQSDVKIIYTRSTDVFIPLIDRSRIANRNKADLFISIHANACPTPSIRGTETFFLGPSTDAASQKLEQLENSVIYLEEDYKKTYDGFDPNSSESDIIFANIISEYAEQSLNFAVDIQQQFTSKIQTPNRGVKQAGFLVLRQSSMPSVLVEAGFVSNLAEAKWLNSEEGQQQVAESLYEAFKKFKAKRTGTPINSIEPILASTEKMLETNSVEKQTDTVVSKKTDLNKEVAVVTQTEPEKDEPEKEIKQIINETVEKPKINQVEPKKEIKSGLDETVEKPITSEVIYSIQIGANTSPVEPVPGNFKGLKNIRRDKVDKYYRYYVGSESSIEKITPLLQQIKLKFPQAFVVSFVDGKRVPIFTGAK